MSINKDLIKKRKYHMNEALAEVREDDVTKLFRNKAFRRNLKQAAIYTKQTGYESGFHVIRDLYLGSYYVSRVTQGITDSLPTEEDLFEKNFNYCEYNEQNDSSGRCYRFFDLHFHPGATKYPIPSYYDLLTSHSNIENGQKNEQLEVCPVMAVSHVLNDDTIISLLYQKIHRFNTIQLQTLKELNSDLDKIAITNPSEVVDYLKRSGLFRADTLILEKKRHYSPNKEDYSRLKAFTCTPCRRYPTSNKNINP
jgi:hypothetical protein